MPTATTREPRLRICLPEMTQEQQIRNARSLLRPGKVERGVLPDWLIERFVAYCARREIHADNESPHAITRVICKEAGIESNVHWIDHYGTSTESRFKCCCEAGECFVSEPYSFCTHTSRILDAICEALDLSWHILSNSYHYPGHALRIVLHRRLHLP
jgi:hypothetical protein